jgi:hypothetical protein
MREDLMQRLMRVTTAVLLVAAAACGGDSTGPNGQTNGDMTAKIDGSAWSSVATFATRSPTGSGTIVAVSGSDAHSSAISFGFTDAGVGTYTIGATNGTNANVFTSAGAGWSASAIAGSGAIVVTALDASHIAGTFSFVGEAVAPAGATGTKTVSQGVFNVTF